MEVSRSFCGKWEKYIGRVNMMLEVISKFGIVCDLGGVRMSSLVASAGRGKNEVSEHWSMRVVEESNEHVGAFAGGNRWAGTRLALAFENRQGSVLAGVPGMNVSGRLGDSIRLDKRNIVVMEVADNVPCSTAEAVAQCIVQ